MRTVRIISANEAMHRDTMRLAYAIVLIPLTIAFFLLTKVVIPFIIHVVLPALTAMLRWAWSVMIPALRSFVSWLGNVAFPAIGNRVTQLFRAVSARIPVSGPRA